MRRILTITTVTILIAVAGCAIATDQANAPTARSTTAVLIKVPDVVGENAAVAVDDLETLGFTDIGLGTVDGRMMVVLPENWTVQTQSARPGTRRAADAKIVLGCARIG